MQFAQDVIENTNDPDFLRHFYKAINKVTILDPTCGSGAFLFAAMNILEPLYEACLMRMRAFVEEEDRLNEEEKRSFKNQYKFFRQVLAETQNEHHPNLQYFIYKSIILQNLYGVDIMKEAVEIAKLRLFLKLVATVDADYRKPNLGLEPLPDIDFNIRAGNTLVGFATEKEIDDAFTETLDFDNDAEKIKEKCDIVARTFTRYKEIQLSTGDDYTDFKAAKEELNKRLKELNHELNLLLHKQASGLRYEDWLTSHQPFHWFAEFYEIIHDRDGFDVIIGNPPYVEYPSDIEYKIINYKTLPCGNLYAFVLERISKISNQKSDIGQIIPVSIISTPGYKTLRKLYYALGLNYFSSYNIHPSCLFEGANPRLVISITKKQEQIETFVSGYNKWYAEERESLFNQLSYNSVNSAIIDRNIERSIPKISVNTALSVLSKFIDGGKMISNFFERTISSETKSFYYRRAFGAFVLFYDFIPKMFDENGNKMFPTELKKIHFRQKYEDIILGLYYSNIFYLSTYTFSDCRNINKPEIEEFYIDLEEINDQCFIRLSKLSCELSEDLEHNSEMMDYNYKSGRRIFQAFFPRKSKPIIDRIDVILAEHYGFTEEELDFIINYDIKYRMGKELNDGEEDE